MSYTNETTHYGIPLPLGTDKTTPMDYNESMQEVDTVLFGAKSDSDSALRKAQQVEEGLSQTDETVSSINGRVTTLEGTSVTHGNAIQQNAQNIADVRADALDMIEAKDEGTAQVATIAVNKGEYFRYNDVLYIATQNIAVGATIVPNTNCKATNVGTELEQVNNSLQKYHRRVAYYKNTSKTYAQCLGEIANQLDALQLDDEQIANVCLEVGNSSGSFNLARLTRHNKANGYYNFEFFDSTGTILTVYSARKTSSGVANTATEITCATGVSNNISSVIVAQEWRVYV